MGLFRELGFPHWEADALSTIGWYHGHLGDHASARTALHKALDLFIHHHDHHGQANAEDSLGYIALNIGDHTDAVRHYAKSLTLWRGLGHSHGEADALAGLAAAYTALGEQHNATRTGRQALALFRNQHRPTEAARLQRDLLNRAGPATGLSDAGEGGGPHTAVNNPLGNRHTCLADTDLGGHGRASVRMEKLSKAGNPRICPRRGIRKWKFRNTSTRRW
jgi:tetratricopeptide (TPR) repeat protein